MIYFFYLKFVIKLAIIYLYFNQEFFYKKSIPYCHIKYYNLNFNHEFFLEKAVLYYQIKCFVVYY